MTRTALADAGVRTRRELAERVARDGLAGVAADEAARVRIRDTLAAWMLAEAEGKTRPRARRVLDAALANWREAAAAVAAVLLAVGVVRALSTPERQVVARRDLPAFHVIGTGDVREERTEAPFGTFRGKEEVVDRFPLEAVPAGAALRQGQLSGVRAPRAELDGRRIASLAVPAHALPLASPGSRVALALSPRGAGAGAIIDDAIVLAARGEGERSSVTVAIREEDAALLTRLLGSSDVHLLPKVVPAGLR